MQTRYLYPILFYFFLSAAVTAIADAQLLSFRSYSIENGLSQSVVNDMIQDSNGYIWVATGYGLNRFDGLEFQSYYDEHGLSDNKIYSLYEDNQGRIWIGTGRGVNVFDVKEDTIRTLPALEPLANNSVLEIYQADKEEFWFATDGIGVWVFDNGEMLNQYTAIHGLANDRVRDITEDTEGTLWFGTRGGLTSLKDGNFRSYTNADGLPEDHKVRDLVIDHDGILWIATRGGLSRFDKGAFTNFTEEDGLINNRVQSLSLDNDGNLWLGTEEGTSYFKKDEKTFSNYSVEQGLSNNIVYTTLYDREQNIWFGTFGGGISVFLGEKFVNYTVEEGLPNNVVTAITEDKVGKHWITTYGGGMAQLENNSFTILNASDGLIDNKVYDIIADRDNRLFVGTRWGLSIYDNGQFYNFDETELPFRKIKTIIESKEGDGYWMGTYGEGVLHYKDGTFTQYSEEDGLVNNTVLSVAEHDGAVWFATHGGISRFKDGEFSNYTIREGLPNNGVLDFLVDRSNNLWFTTYGGIVRYTGESFQTIDATDGLPDEVCYFMIQDNSGLFWIGSNKGVIEFDYAEFKMLEGTGDRSSAFKLITKDQGLIANEMNAGAGFKDSEGILWFGSVGGLSRFDPRLKKSNQTPPKVHIQNLRVGEIRIPPQNGLKLTGDQSILLQFIGINFTAPEQVTYEYRLRGLDEDWQRTTQRTVRYSALLPGDFRFEVRAQNNDGVWSEEYASIQFTVMAPFWMQWWFVILLLGIITGIIYFIYHYYRVRKMVDMERMRVRIASDLHDDVGSSLTEIALHSDFLQTTGLDREFKKSLEQIGTQCRKIVSSLDDIVWSIDARNDTLGDLTDRMQDYINNVLTDKQVRYEFEDLDMDEKLSVSMKENLYLIFKEAINNISKHSDATEIEVTLTNSNGTFDMYIHDNGSGLKQDTKKTGHGLRNMKMRAERINADIEFINNSGFTVHVSGKGM